MYKSYIELIEFICYLVTVAGLFSKAMVAKSELQPDLQYFSYLQHFYNSFKH